MGLSFLQQISLEVRNKERGQVWAGHHTRWSVTWCFRLGLSPPRAWRTTHDGDLQ